MALSEKIKGLRSLIGETEGARKEFYTCSHLPIGVPKGSLIELSGQYHTEWLIDFLKENKDLKVFWCEERQSIFPTAISQRGVKLDRILFGVLKKDLFSSLRKVIQSQVFEIVITPSLFKELKLLKALQLFSEKANTTVFLLTKKHQSAWPISVQLEINPGQSKRSYEINIQKNRYESLGCG